MKRILVIEDNPDICQVLQTALNDAGYAMQAALTGLDGFQYFREHHFDLVLLDIMLPYKSGDEVLREIRELSDIPVIVLSAKDRTSVKVDLLKAGADDYVTKPFDLDEILARIEAQLRRRSGMNGCTVLTFKDISLNCQDLRVTLGQQEIALTARETQLLKLLMEYPNKVFTKANLYETLWNETEIGDDNAVKTHISNLRAKLKAAGSDSEYIETVWGLGYRLSKE